MRWHKIVTQIPLLLFIINVSRTAPVVVREVFKACANRLDIHKDMSAVSWKRVDGEGDSLTQASQIGPSDSDQLLTPSKEAKLPSGSEHEEGLFAVRPPSDSDHESMEVHGASSPKQTFTQADWQSMFANRPWWRIKGSLSPSPVSSTASEDSSRAGSIPEFDSGSEMARRPTEVHLSDNPGSWTTSDDGSMTSDDASMEVHDATSPILPLTQSDRWSMSTNLPSSPASSTFSDDGSTDFLMGTSEIQSVSSNNFHSASSEFHPSSDNYPTLGESLSPNPDDHRPTITWTTSFEEPESTSFLSKLVSKLKFWRRISDTASGA